MSTINKILVIGAGIAGPAVCYWLKRFGFSPILIEKYANIRKGGQALDLRGVAIDLVKRMGIYEKICNMRTQIEFGRYVNVEGNTLHEEKGERFSFVEANQKLGVWVSESFLAPDEVSKEVAEERSNKIMEEVKIVSNMISLPEYE